MESAKAPYVDAHCHLADPRCQNDLQPIIERSHAANVGIWVQGGVSPEDWERQLRLREQFPGVLPCFGLHPWWVSEQTESTLREALTQLEKRLEEGMALGEVGLDSVAPYGEGGRWRLQRLAVESQLILARKKKVPLVLHVVRAHSEMLERLEQLGPFPDGGLVHGFTGSYEVAKRYLDMGFCLSLGGAMARKGFQKIKTALKSLPLDRITLETDCPGTAPAREPADLAGIAEAVGAILNLPATRVLEMTAANAKRLFLKEC